MVYQIAKNLFMQLTMTLMQYNKVRYTKNTIQQHPIKTSTHHLHGNGYHFGDTLEAYMQDWCYNFSHLCCFSSSQNMKAADHHSAKPTKSHRLDPIRKQQILLGKERFSILAIRPLLNNKIQNIK